MDEIIAIMETISPNILNNEVENIQNFMISNGASVILVDRLAEVSEILSGDYSNIDESLGAIEIYETSLISSGGMSTALLESINVLKSSLCYWNDNGQEWSEIDFIDGENQARGFWDTINDMDEADFWSFAVGTVMLGPYGGVASGLYGSGSKGLAAVIDGSCC